MNCNQIIESIGTVIVQAAKAGLVVLCFLLAVAVLKVVIVDLVRGGRPPRD